MTRLALVLAFLLLGVGSPLPSSAASDEPGQVTEKELRERAEWWKRLPSEERDRLRGRFREYRSLPPRQQSEMQGRLKQWRRLRPEDRVRMRERYGVYRNLEAGERQRIRENLRQWNRMSPAERTKIRERFEGFQKLDREQRRKLMEQHRGQPSGSRTGPRRLEPDRPHDLRGGQRGPGPSLQPAPVPPRPGPRAPGVQSPRTGKESVR